MKGNILNFTAESAVPAFRFAKIGTAEGKVKPAAANDACIGISTDIDIAEGMPCDIQLDGIARVEAGGSVSFGANLVPDANGKAVAVTSGTSYAVALEGGASGDIIRVKIMNDYTPAPAPESGEGDSSENGGSQENGGNQT